MQNLHGCGNRAGYNAVRPSLLLEVHILSKFKMNLCIVGVIEGAVIQLPVLLKSFDKGKVDYDLYRRRKNRCVIGVKVFELNLDRSQKDQSNKELNKRSKINR